MMQKLPVFAAFIALAASAWAVPAQAEVVEQKPSAFITRDSVVVEASQREVWLAVISPNRWWNEAHTFSGKSANLSLMPNAGGCFCERMPGEDTAGTIGLDGSVEHMRVILAIPDQALRMRGNLGPLQSEPVNAVLTITISKVDAGSRIVFEYAVGGYMRYETPVIAKAVDAVVTQQMMGLAKELGLIVTEDATEPDDESGENVDAPDEANADSDAAVTTQKKAAPALSVDEAFGDLTGER